MINDKKISVVVPIYNLENYLESCINSILDQTHKNIEIIAVDDGSTDNSFVKLQELQKKDSRITVIHKENGGVSSARLEGLKYCQGDWVSFIDGDDQLDNIMFEKLLALAYENNADISHCGYKMIFPNKINKFYGTHKMVIQDNHKGIEDLLMGDYVEPGLCNKLYKKEIIDLFLKNDSSDIDKSIKINEDLLMNFYLFKYSNKSVYFDECYYNYMIRDESASRGCLNKNKIFDPIKVRNLICQNSDISIKKLAEFVRLRTTIYVYLTIVLENNYQYNKDKKTVKNYIKEYSKNVHYLNKKIKILSVLIIYFSYLFDSVYRVYYRLLQDKIYS